jgi:hypothetical protein
MLGNSDIFGLEEKSWILKIWDGIFKLLSSPGITSKELIPSSYVAWRPGTTTLYLLGS